MLAPLLPDTEYHIVVTAEDPNGGRSSRSGTITTVAPAAAWGAHEPGGCAANCVKKALLTPRPGSAEVDLTVDTPRPATTGRPIRQGSGHQRPYARRHGTARPLPPPPRPQPVRTPPPPARCRRAGIGTQW